MLSYFLLQLTMINEQFDLLKIILLNFIIKKNNYKSNNLLNFIVITFSNEQSCWLFTDETHTPTVFSFRAAYFKCIESPDYLHFKQNCLHDPEVREVLYYFWSINDLDKLLLWVDLNNLNSVTYFCFLDPLFLLSIIISSFSFVITFSFKVMQAIVVDGQSNIINTGATDMVLLTTHNNNILRSEELWFSSEIVYGMPSVVEQKESTNAIDLTVLQKPSNNELGVDGQSNIINTGATDMVLLTTHNNNILRSEELWFRSEIVYGMPSVVEQKEPTNAIALTVLQKPSNNELGHFIITDKNFFINIYLNQSAKFGNDIHSYTDCSLENIRLNIQRISLNEYSKVTHSFMRLLLDSERQYRIDNGYWLQSEDFKYAEESKEQLESLTIPFNLIDQRFNQQFYDSYKYYITLLREPSTRHLVITRVVDPID